MIFIMLSGGQGGIRRLARRDVARAIFDLIRNLFLDEADHELPAITFLAFLLGC